MKTMWTDYPMTELGDVAGRSAPTRAVRLISFDGDKYATVEVMGVQKEIKMGYLRSMP